MTAPKPKAVGRRWVAYGPEWIIGWMALNRGLFLLGDTPTTNPINGAAWYGAAFLIASGSCFALATVAPFSTWVAYSRVAVLPMVLAVVCYVGYAINIVEQFGLNRTRGQAVDLLGIAALCGWTWADTTRRAET